MKISIPVLLILVIVVCLIGIYFTTQNSAPTTPKEIAQTAPQEANQNEPAQNNIIGNQGTEQMSSFCLGGCPANMPRDDEHIVHHIYELENNPHTKFADWVAYKISTQTLGSGCKRIWKRDPDLPEEDTLDPKDYVGMRAALSSDRGHQAPLASLCGSPYWEEADYLSNITPQRSDLNEGAWERLENAERRLITDRVTDSVYSITGPLYERQMPSLPRSHLEETTPSGYWKVISYQVGTNIYAAVFVMDQEFPKEADYCGTSVGIDDLEKRSHLDFFPNLNPPPTGSALLHEKSALIALGC